MLFGRGYFRGEITKLAPPLVINGGVLYEEPITGRSSHWIVQIPHATFTGILQLDGLTHRLRGTAYQDHQWGTILIQEFGSDWVWGHFSDEQVAVIFFQILTQNGRLIERVAFVNEEGMYTGTSVETGFLDTLFQTDRPEEFAAKTSVSYLNQCMQLDFGVSPTGLMRSRIGEEQGHNTASYLRWSAVGTLQSGCVSQPLHGISEYIRICPAMYGSLSKSKHHQHHIRHHDGDHLSNCSAL